MFWSTALFSAPLSWSASIRSTARSVGPLSERGERRCELLCLLYAPTDARLERQHAHREDWRSPGDPLFELSPDPAFRASGAVIHRR